MGVYIQLEKIEWVFCHACGVIIIQFFDGTQTVIMRFSVAPSTNEGERESERLGE